MASPQALSAAHLAGDAHARAWLGEPWAGIRPCAARARAFLAAGRWQRPELSSIATEAGAARTVARMLADPAAGVVVTGQQPAVGGGPLYTLVKLAHAIALAQRLGEEGVPALAWFWCASDDHDLGEANHADLVLRDGSIDRVTADLGEGRSALRWRPAATWWGPLTTRCQQQLGAGLGARWLLDRAPRAGEGMGAWLCRILGDLFAGLPFVAVEAHQVRRLWRGRLPLAPTSWPERELALRRGELLQHGNADPFGELAGPPLFHDLPAGRIAVDQEAAGRIATAAPEELSPGAALRPVLQQIALPAVAAILGPGEIAYHAAIGPLYPALGAPPPQLIPRCSLTLLPNRVAHAAQRLGLDPEDLAEGAPATAVQLPLAQDSRLLALEDAIRDLAAGAAPDDRRIAAAQTRLRRELARLRASLERGARVAAGLPSPGSIAGQLRPCGKRQERVISLFQAVWEHGPGLAAELVHAASSTAPGDHRLVPLVG